MFIGDKEIDSIKGTEVKFTDGTTKIFTKTSLKYLKQKEACDLTNEMELVRDNVCKDIFILFKKNDMFNSEIDNVQEIKENVLSILEKHDVSRIHTHHILEHLKNLGTNTLGSILGGVQGDIGNTFENAISIAFKTNNGTQLHTENVNNIRISDIKRVKNNI